MPSQLTFSKENITNYKNFSNFTTPFIKLSTN